MLFLRTKKSRNLLGHKKSCNGHAGPIAPKLVHKAPNCSKCHQICPKGSKQVRIFPNGSKFFFKRDKTGPNGTIWSHQVPMGSNGSIRVQYRGPKIIMNPIGWLLNPGSPGSGTSTVMVSHQLLADPVQPGLFYKPPVFQQPFTKRCLAGILQVAA